MYAEDQVKGLWVFDQRNVQEESFAPSKKTAFVRKKLKLKTHRVSGVFVIPPAEELQLWHLFER